MPSQDEYNIDQPEQAAGGPAPDTVTLLTSDVNRHNQLLNALATALGLIMTPNTGVVIVLEGHLHVVSKTETGDINLSAINGNEQLAPGQIVTITTTPPQDEVFEDFEGLTPEEEEAIEADIMGEDREEDAQ